MRVLIVALFMSAFSLCVTAEESEHNYKAKIGDWEYTYRHREGRWHVEAGNKISVEGRIEYRDFDNKESHWRYRFITEYTPHLFGNFYLYAKWQPRWSMKDAGVKFDSRDQLGITYKGSNWKVTPFIERNSTEGYNLKQVVYGTHFEAKF